MDKIRRNERMSAMMKILAAKPNRIFTLSYFCDLFGSAKSTMSEDIDILRDVVAHWASWKRSRARRAAFATARRFAVPKRANSSVTSASS